MSKYFGFFSDEPIGQVMNSLLFFGSMPDEMVNPGPEVDDDIPHQNELKRRREIVKKDLEILKMGDRINTPRWLTFAEAVSPHGRNFFFIATFSISLASINMYL